MAVTSFLYPYHKNKNGAWDRFLHVRIQQPGRPHTSPPHDRSIKAAKTECPSNSLSVNSDQEQPDASTQIPRPTSQGTEG